mgnify:CR=1 FL=1
MQTGHSASEQAGKVSRRDFSPKTRHLLYKAATYLLVSAAFIFFYDWLTRGPLSGLFGMVDISRKAKGYFVPICAWVVSAISLNRLCRTMDSGVVFAEGIRTSPSGVR